MMLLSRIFIIVVICVVGISCNKVVQINVRDSDIKYVVEGVITNEPGVCMVNITRTKGFDERNEFEKISGASVKVYDNNEVFELQETEPGKYRNTVLTGIPGHVYRLEIVTGDQIFTSTSTMPHPVAMDSLYVKAGPFGQFKFATIDYTDPAGYENGYRFVQYVNGVKEPTVFWENDEFTNGQLVTMQLDASADEKDDPRNIKTGDEVTVEMLTIDEPVFRFWYSVKVDGADGNGFSAAPANPITNISGGALGYFSAHTVDRRTVTSP